MNLETFEVKSMLYKKERWFFVSARGWNYCGEGGFFLWRSFDARKKRGLSLYLSVRARAGGKLLLLLWVQTVEIDRFAPTHPTHPPTRAGGDMAARRKPQTVKTHASKHTRKRDEVNAENRKRDSSFDVCFFFFRG